ncbi:hypothetical protein ACFOMD_02245 [Sphingoaurantiacus capsulatus]|uniref:Uncharacterized protein n=1 Tax=Sphingoaurantiacus capsulatus TaxID=1771310 RepID=A0ABV7X5U8_9SPHN
MQRSAWIPAFAGMTIARGAGWRHLHRKHMLVPVDELRNLYGQSIEEWLAGLRLTLEDDAVSLCQIVGGAVEFRPPNEALHPLVCRALLEMLNAGGIPSEGNAAKNGWQPIAHYQGNVQQTADHLVNHCIRKGAPPDLGDPWLVLPRNM